MSSRVVHFVAGVDDVSPHLTLMCRLMDVFTLFVHSPVLQLLTRCDDPDGIAIREGAVINLMIIMLFRSDDITTKYACAMALFNIAANASSRTAMIKDGVLWSMVKASKEAKSESMKKICARFIANVFCDQALLLAVMDNKGISVSV